MERGLYLPLADPLSEQCRPIVTVVHARNRLKMLTAVMQEILLALLVNLLPEHKHVAVIRRSQPLQLASRTLVGIQSDWNGECMHDLS